MVSLTNVMSTITVGPKSSPPFAEASLKLRKQLRLERDGYSIIVSFGLFDYRLGHQVFILKRRVRFPYRVQDDGIREDEFRKDKVTNPCRKRIERVNGVIIYSPLAQLEEHLPYMQGVVGSIPTGTTKNDKVGSKTRPKSEVKTRQNRKL